MTPAEPVIYDAVGVDRAEGLKQGNIFQTLGPVVPLVSHELNTALAAVLGNAHILRERGEALDPEDRVLALRDIESHAERLFSAIQNLLLFARLETGEKPYSQPLLLSDLLNREVALERSRRPDRRVRIRIIRGRDPIAADERLLKVLLRNLLENAYEYSGPDKDVAVALFQGRHAVKLHVLDRGPGIAEEEWLRVFQPFYRSPTVTDRHPGLGLGLTVAQNIAIIHGGRIDITNRRRGGACFCLTLPLVGPAF